VSVTNGLAPALLAAMMGLVSVEAINVGLSETIMPVGSVSALAGEGLMGDRHFSGRGAQPGLPLTLIEAEALEDAGLTGAESRSQVVVRGCDSASWPAGASRSGMSSVWASSCVSRACIRSS
jgi:hypothetical protein